jgi:hypothetical protein
MVIDYYDLKEKVWWREKERRSLFHSLYLELVVVGVCGRWENLGVVKK